MSLDTDCISPHPAGGLDVWIRQTTSLVGIAPPVRRSIPSDDQGGSSWRPAADTLSDLVLGSGRSGHTTDVTPEQRFHALFDEHYGTVMRFLRTRGHESHAAGDLVAETFEVAWRNMHKVPEGRDAVPWLLGVARNLSRNARRKSQRETSFVDELSMVTIPWTEMPTRQRTEAAEVMGALAQLTPDDRDLILLVAWDELSPSEAGRVLGLRPVTARSRLHRARRRLHRLLETSAPPAGEAARRSPGTESP